MNTVRLNRLRWSELDEPARAAALARPASSSSAELNAAVARILEQVRADGDSTLRALTRRFDGCELADFRVSTAEFDAAEASIAPALKLAIEDSRRRIERFHRKPGRSRLRCRRRPA